MVVRYYPIIIKKELQDFLDLHIYGVIYPHPPSTILSSSTRIYTLSLKTSEGRQIEKNSNMTIKYLISEYFSHSISRIDNECTLLIWGEGGYKAI